MVSPYEPSVNDSPLTTYNPQSTSIEKKPEETKEEEKQEKEKAKATDEDIILDPSITSPEEILRLKFKYYFNKDEVLTNTETDEGFKFINQAHYERLGNVIQRFVQEQMCKRYEMIEEFVPKEPQFEGSPKCNIFISKNWFGECNKAMLLIQGAGAVRAGLWARSVCINDSLKTGSVFPFLDFAKENGFEVIVFNPNYCYDPETHKPIPMMNSLESHGNYLWENYVRHCKASELYIVAHSCGGISTMSLVKNYWDEFKERVKGIAFTDAVHGYYGVDKEKVSFLRRVAVDWVASRDPLDTPQRSYGEGVIFVSSGHHKHEYTTGYAYPSIFRFFQQINERNPYLDNSE